jgi:membrane glycosyltransferase
MTPANLQSTTVINWRRAIMAAFVGTTLALFAYGFTLVLGDQGWCWLDISMLITFMITLPRTVIIFWESIIGFILLLRGIEAALLKVSPFTELPPQQDTLILRCAVLMTLRNEDPERSFKRLRIIRESIDATVHGRSFGMYVLSDTSDPVIGEAEEQLARDWQEKFEDTNPNFYRRRRQNDGYKAGNLGEFLARLGSKYDLMLPLDADSLMSGNEIVKLVTIMQRHPKIGILQTRHVGAPSGSPFARICQFGFRLSLRAYSIGKAWWNADCGSYWGHNAMVRVAPFMTDCQLPVLPGKPPFGGWLLSHDTIEAMFMRRAGYEVRVFPMESESWEDTPPTLPDYIKREKRWCQGNLQHSFLIGFPGLLPFHRFQILYSMLGYAGPFCWPILIALSTVKIFDQSMTQSQIFAAVSLYIGLHIMIFVPRITGILYMLLTPGEIERFGGILRLTTGVVIEIIFSFLMASIVAIAITIFIIRLLFMRGVTWSGQQRDANALSAAVAARLFWPQTLLGLLLFVLLGWKAPGAIPWASPMLISLTAAIPFAVLTASPRFGKLLAHLRLCSTPEEFKPPPEIAGLSQIFRR